MSTGIGTGACCLSGKVHRGTPQGRVEIIGGIPTYVAETEDGSKARAVIFISDIFGWELKNIRLLADDYAKAGFYSYVPDFHEGDSLPESFLQTVEPPLKEQEKLGLVDRAKNVAIVPATLAPWLVGHREAVTRPLVDHFVDTVRMIPGTNKIGAVGFCWGGRYAILQAHHRPGKEAGGRGPVGGADAAFAAHPSMVAVPADLDPVSKPLSIALGTKDSLVDEKTRGGISEILSRKVDVPTEVRIYEDQVHGFALRGDWSSDRDRQAMDEAGRQGIEWFTKFLSS